MQGDIGTGMAMEQLCYAQVIGTEDRLEGLKVTAWSSVSNLAALLSCVAHVSKL